MKRSIGILIILPVIYCFVICFFYLQSRYFFTTTPDPVYCYLINGTNLANGVFDVGHFDHPGTPVQWLTGVIIFFSHIFISGSPANQSVFADPELYLGISAGVLICLLMLSVFLSGKLIYDHTHNLPMALAFQLIPVSSYISVTFMARIMPESLLIISLNYYLAFLWVHCHKKENISEFSYDKWNNILGFSFFSALLITTKITCFPFIFIPLFFINRFQQKILFLITTFIVAAIIIFPVWPKLPKMFGWLQEVATHSGHYGGGKDEILDTSVFLSNIRELLFTELFFFTGYLAISFTVVVGFILKIWKNNFFRLALAFWLVCTIQLLLAGKHFKFYYILPAQLVIIPGVFASYCALVNVNLSKVIRYGFLLVCSAFLIYQFSKNSVSLNYGQDVYYSSLKARKYENIPKIITTGFEGSSFVESALHFGAAYGGDFFYSSNFFLREKYPNAYFYDLIARPGFVNFWEVKVYPDQLVEKHPELLFYFLGMKEGDEQEIIKNLFKGFEPVIKDIKVDDYNSLTGERFYLISIDTLKANPGYEKIINIEYDFEKKSDDNLFFLSRDENSIIGDANKQSTEQYVSGRNSVLILPDEYPFISKFQVDPGDAIDISVNFLSTDRPVGISVSAPGTFFERNSESIVEINKNGWGKVRLKAVIPEDFPDREIIFCLFYYGHKSCYVDDLNIILSMKTFNVDSFNPPINDKFILRGSDNKFLSITEEYNLLAENQIDSSKAEVFEIIKIANGKTAFKATTGKFLCADQSQSGLIIVNRDIPYEWESFEVFFLDKNKIQIKGSNGKFVGKDRMRGIYIANCNEQGEAETFFLVPK